MKHHSKFLMIATAAFALSFAACEHSDPNKDQLNNDASTSSTSGDMGTGMDQPAPDDNTNTSSDTGRTMHNGSDTAANQRGRQASPPQENNSR